VNQNRQRDLYYSILDPPTNEGIWQIDTYFPVCNQRAPMGFTIEWLGALNVNIEGAEEMNECPEGFNQCNVLSFNIPPIATQQ